ncbi:MerR family transcriptional regulator [Prauserella shujinwangii]|uniref:MerR family transcriptional regulator n=1 Tax=Prauserella shujinwangii TaxID=1453103 RepID=UPI0011B22757|nr:protein phosphatase 2C domain-containing protein [Prauserella shujinwangii]
MEELLTIGEFSARSGLSPKMLRAYAAAGLLTPAAVDRSNGYRYYAPAQVPEAELIAVLRRGGVALADIAAFLRDPTPARVAAWERALDAEYRSRREALTEVRARMTPGTAAPPITRTVQEKGPVMTNLTAATATDTGTVRPENQDRVLAEDAIFAVADGFGEQGRAASRLAVDTMRAALTGDRTRETLADAVRQANRAVWREGGEAPASGTTLLALVAVAGGGLVAANVGDSRGYRLRGQQLTRVTADHSVAADLVRAGELTERDARNHPRRSLLTRAVGVGPEVAADLVEIVPQPGDRLLLCTDGLFNELEDDRIAEVLRSAADPEDAASELTRLAASHGGGDNISAVVIDVGVR